METETLFALCRASGARFPDDPAGWADETFGTIDGDEVAVVMRRALDRGASATPAEIEWVQRNFGIHWPRPDVGLV